MRIVVTGGLGAVGKYLVKELEQDAHEVWVVGRSHDPARNYIRCDVARFQQLERIFLNKGAWANGYAYPKGPVDIVYHLAAEFGRWNGEDYYETLWATNAVGTKNVIRLQERFGFKAVYFSSSEVYGDYEGEMKEEVMERVAIRQMNDYAISKWVNEMQIMNSADQYKTQSVRVRLFNTYGPGEIYSPYRSVICLFVYRALHGLPYTVYTGHKRTSTYITDMARTLANIAKNFKSGEVYNIAGLDYHDIKTVSDLIIKETDARESKIVTFKEAEPFTTKQKLVSCDKAIRDLQHKPKVELEEGIRNTVAWMKEFYKL